MDRSDCDTSALGKATDSRPPGSQPRPRSPREAGHRPICSKGVEPQRTSLLVFLRSCCAEFLLRQAPHSKVARRKHGQPIAASLAPPRGRPSSIFVSESLRQAEDLVAHRAFFEPILLIGGAPNGLQNRLKMARVIKVEKNARTASLLELGRSDS